MVAGVSVSRKSIAAEAILAGASWRSAGAVARKVGCRHRFAAVRVWAADGPPQRIRDMVGRHMPGDEAWLVSAVRYFAGLDVSLEETAICIIDETGAIVREARVVSEPDALVAFFDALGMTRERVGLEACSLTAWLHQGLSEAGISAVCIEARQAKAAMGAMPNKTDRNDARGIAQIMRTGWYRAAHVKARPAALGVLC